MQSALLLIVYSPQGLRSFANFQKLRNSEHAQLEIREIAGIMLELVKNIDGQPFEHTLSAWELMNE